MGKTTVENYRKLKTAEKYEDAKLSGMISHEFSLALDRFIREKNISIMTIVENTNLSKSYINKLRNPSDKKANPSRRVVIDIALALNATLAETNQLLKLARYQELYTRDKAESLIIWGMLKKLDGKEIRKMLQEKGLDGMFKEK